MCGFACMIDGRPVDADAVEAVLAARGPDGRGVICDEHRWLLHRRLSIIDTTDASAQPFEGSPPGAVTLYNGELYNYAELRRSFDDVRTAGDTEVFARLLSDTDLSSARGMFAGAQMRGNSATITRDRFGIKPLYYTNEGGTFAVASQLRCFPYLGGHRSIDERAIASVLRFGCVVGSTMFAGVHEFPPSATARFDHGSLTFDAALPPVAATARGGLAAALERAVQRHLVSDVPVAVLLSGGLDSAIVAKLAAAAGQPPTAITLSTGGAIDEGDRARRTAGEYRLDHRVLPVEIDLVATSLDDFFDAVDQPSIDGLNTFLVTRAVANAGFKVALSGLGADELFGGYSSFRRIAATHAARRLPPVLLERLLAGRSGNHQKVERWVAARHDRSLLATISREVFSADEVAQMCGSRFEPTIPHLEGADEVIDSEVWRYMAPMLLRDSDTHSMANSVELRVPFLDDEVVAAALARSSASRAVIGKRAIPHALDDDYLRSVARAPKTGFRLPVDRWLDGPLAKRLDAALAPGSRLSEHLDIDQARAAGSSGPWSRRWCLIVLNEWLERHA